MIRDRLSELQEKCKSHDVANGDGEVTIVIDSNDEQKPLLDLLDKIGPLYSQLKNMKKIVGELHGVLYDHDNRHSFDDIIAKVKSDARKLKSSLDEIKSKGEGNSKLLEHVSKTHHLSLVVHLSIVLQELSAIQAETHERHAQYVRKELIITGQVGMNEDELENLLDNTTEIFTQNLIQETHVARQQLQDLQDRHEAVIQLEKSITQLWQLFQDVALAVEQQGESINRIENHIYVASEKAKKAKEELGEAVVSQQKARKKKFILAIIGAVVLLIIVLIITFSLL